MYTKFRRCTVILAILCMVIVGCVTGSPAGRRSILEIAYTIASPAKGIVPSRLTAIWLEDQQGNYLKPLSVSLYLATASFKHPEICSTWAQKADWQNVTAEQFDAVTSATPRPGSHRLEVGWEEVGLPPGTYRYCVETHIAQNYSILYTGEIEITDVGAESGADLTYIPEKHAKAGDLLSNVQATYRP